MILFVDACARQDSRTRKLAMDVLLKVQNHDKNEGEKEPEEVLRLYDEKLPLLTEELINWRSEKAASLDFSDEYFRFARQFQKARLIIIAAPFWDLSFPAILKQYLEHVSIVGLTFKYSEDGQPIGLCRAEKLWYVTTAGGPLFCPEFGFGYVNALTTGMFGVKECEMVKAEGLDVWGNDAEEILRDVEINLN